MITPNPDFNGTVDLLIGMRDPTARSGLPLDDPAQFDTQQITLSVGAANENNFAEKPNDIHMVDIPSQWSRWARSSASSPPR